LLIVNGFNMTNFTEPITTDLTQTQGSANSINTFFRWLVGLAAFSVVIVLIWLALTVFNDARPAINKFGLGFLTNDQWDVGKQLFGGLSFVYGTLVTSFLSLLLAIPLGLAVALTTSENFVPDWLRNPIGFMVELIAAIPSVIVGLWGIFALIPVIKPLQEWLHANLGMLPFFSTEPLGPSIFIAGILLAIMILPTIAAISRDVLTTVPTELRSASMALGATRWETIWRTLLPAASSGIIGGIILALGRALGETMAVTMVIGNSTIISPSILAPGYSIPAALANQFAEAFEELHIGALMYLALVLFLITLVVNSIAAVMVQYINRNR
jgi:phosphate transport system permease protein